MKYIPHQTPFKEKLPNKVFRNPFILFLLSSLALLFVFIPLTSQADDSCNIVEPFYGTYGPDYYQQVDCGNPFDLTEDEMQRHERYAIAGETIGEGEILEIEEFPVRISYASPMPPGYPINNSTLYRHEGVNYRKIDSNSGGSGPPFVYARATGTYSIVTTFEVYLPPMSKHDNTWWRALVSRVVPTAHAQSLPFRIRSITTFTLTEPAPVTGASNVLFLPGIMGSRLYETGKFCDSEENTEKQLWFSLDECKQERLATNFIGQSLNTIYTKGGEKGVVDDALIIFDIYEEFLDSLKEWKADDIIADYAAVPYDWRMELDDIIRSKKEVTSEKVFPNKASSYTGGYLYAAIAELASSSKSGKVTVVAHSNGGLVIRYLLSHMQQAGDPLLEKIDKVILVAVPQLGAPNSAIGILHGESLDPVMSQEMTRKLMNKMPFAHHLLPVQGYFDLVDTPLIAIESGEVTDDWRTLFGEEILSQADLHDFMSKESGRTKPDREDLATPETVDPFLLQYARTTEAVLDTFVPPPSMTVYQVAGIGLSTPSQLTYFTDEACVSSVLFFCTGYAPKLGYRVSDTADGDGTVPVPSALALSEADNVERWWFNIESYNNDSIFNRSHRDIFEISEISHLIDNLLEDETGSYEYIFTNQPNVKKGERLVFQLHSPLDLSVKTSSGRVVSSSTNEVPNAVYRRYGELQYLTIPREESLEIVLDGQATGSFTLDVEFVGGSGSSRRVTMSGVPVSTSTQVRAPIALSSNIDDLILAIDYDGDGSTDVDYGSDGLRITYDDLFSVIAQAGLPKGQETALLAHATQAEKFHGKATMDEKFKAMEHNSLEQLIKQSIIFSNSGLLKAINQLRIEAVALTLMN